MKKTVVRTIALLALAATAIASETPASGMPNILFILTDDMGWGDPSSFGNKETPTPNIDRLANGGMRFTQFYVASPICSASRVAFMTGSFPARWQINDYLHESQKNKAHECVNWLDIKAPTLARTLHEAGYATAHFGKWHMGGGRDVQNAPWPKEYGFDESHVNHEGCGPRISDPEDEGKKLARYEITGFWADKTMEFIRRHKAGPFFVQFWPQDVHAPYKPNPEELASGSGAPNDRQNFNAVLRGYDREIGRVLDFLKTEGLEQNTIVVFSSDNGPKPSFERQRTGGLRGMKWSLYEGGVREPFLIRWPNGIPAGKTDSRTILSSIDLFPTLCALAGVPMPRECVIDGMDASKACRGEALERSSPLFWEYGRKNSCFFPTETGARSPNLAVRDGKWKLLVNADGSGEELYDLDADSNETSNVAAQNPEPVKRLRSAVLSWRKSLP